MEPEDLTLWQERYPVSRWGSRILRECIEKGVSNTVYFAEYKRFLELKGGGVNYLPVVRETVTINSYRLLAVASLAAAFSSCSHGANGTGPDFFIWLPRLFQRKLPSIRGDDTKVRKLSGSRSSWKPYFRVGAPLASRSRFTVFLLQHLLHLRCNGNAELC